MGIAWVEVSTENVSKSSERMTTKRAWAIYARRRWPKNAVNLAQCEWDLTEGEAKGLVYGHASQATIDKIIDHRRGGMGLALHILEIRCRTKLAQLISDERERLADERRRQEQADAALASMDRDWAAVLRLGSRPAVGRSREPASFARPEDRRMGDGSDA